MNKLHVCFTGLHPNKNFSNMKFVIDKFEKVKNIDVHFHIVFDPNQLGINRRGEKLTILGDKIKQLIEDKGIKKITYDSPFLKTNGSSDGVVSVMIQQESLSSFLHSGICDNDYLLRVRGDVKIRDEDFSRFLDPMWYDKLKNKMFLPFIGDQYVYDFCDYYWLSTVGKNKACIFSNLGEVEQAWSNKNLTRDHCQFCEKILFIKPHLKKIEDENITTISDKYWQLINEHYEIGVIGDHSKRPVLDFNK